MPDSTGSMPLESSANGTSKSRVERGSIEPSRAYVSRSRATVGSNTNDSSNAVLEISRPYSVTPIESSSRGSAPKFSARNRMTSSRPSSSYEEFQGVCDRSVSRIDVVCCAATTGMSKTTPSDRRDRSSTSLRIAGRVILSTVSDQRDDLLDAVDHGDGDEERTDGEPQRAFPCPEGDPCAKPRAGDHAGDEHEKDRPVDVAERGVDDRPRNDERGDEHERRPERAFERHADQQRERRDDDDSASHAEQARCESRPEPDHTVFPYGGLPLLPRRRWRSSPDDLRAGQPDQHRGDEQQYMWVHELREVGTDRRADDARSGSPPRGAVAHLSRARVCVRCHDRRGEDHGQRRRHGLDGRTTEERVDGRLRDHAAAHTE